MQEPFGPLLLIFLTVNTLIFPTVFGRLEFIKPVTPKDGIAQVRVHVGAEKGLRLVSVKALDRDAPNAVVQYKLLKDGGGDFKIDPRTGDLSTSRQLDDVEADDTIKLLVVAAGDGQTKSLELEVYVTEFNAHAPVFDKVSYGAEVSEDLAVGSVIARVHAADEDTMDYNRNVTYRLEEETSQVGSWVRVDADTGDVIVRKKLDASRASWLEVHVVAEDEGSPPRAAKAKLDISVKSLTAPRDVRWENSTASTSRICWLRPERGSVQGYLVRYRDADRSREQVHTFNVTSTDHSQPPNKTSQVTTDGSQTSTERDEQCVRLEGLRGGTHYEFRLYAWNEREVGLGSQLYVLSTKANPCETKICGEHGTCRETSDEPWFRCECRAGYEGTHCEEDVNECESNPCLNDAKCSDLQNGYSCTCPAGFKGKQCEEDIDECDTDPCDNGGTCTDGPGHYSCDCAPGFLGPTCRENINECSSNPCLNGGSCVDGPGGFVCRCTKSFRGMTCNIQNFCAESEVTTSRGSFTFNVTFPGKHAEAPCPYGAVKGTYDVGVATRQCLLFVLDSPAVRWGKVNDSACRREEMRKVDAITDQLQMMTSNGSALNVDQVKNTTQDLESVIDYATADRTVANSVVKVISNVLDADSTSFGEVTAENPIHRRLSHLVRRIATETSLEAGEEFTLNTPNIILTTRTASDIANEVEFRSFPQSNSTIDVPAEAVHKARDSVGNANVQFIAYSNSKLFRERDDDTAMSRYTPSNRQVFEVSFGNSTIQNLTSRVHYSVGKPLHGAWLCVFWNETGGLWSTEGMFTNQTDDVAFCQSDHMTAFSILLDPNPNNRLSPGQERTLSIISYIGSGLSVIGLILTIITYSLFKTLNRDRAGKLLLNLCVSLLMLNLSFLAGALRSSDVKQTPGTDYLCVTIAILTHYFLLTSLGWMCVEATHMYQLLVYVFATGETRFLIKRLVIAWGAPFLVVGITAAIRISSYSSTDEYCMLSPTNAYVYYIAFLGPMCLLLVVNTVVFVMVARILFQPHMASKIPIVPAKGSWGQRPPRVTWAQVRGAFTVMTLLGVAWVFGAFAVGPARVLFQYIFCVLNSLQGALIFFVRCIHYPEARAAWMHLWRTGQRKRTRGTPSAQLVNTSSTASTFTSGGGAGHQNSARSKILSCVTHFRKSTKRGDSAPVPQSTSNPVVAESEEKVEERTVPGDSEPTAPKAWVYGGPTEVAASEGTFMATLRQAPQTQKRRPSSPGSERLNLKEGRDTGWQYLDLQPEGILFIEDTDEEDSVTVAASTQARDRGGPPDGTGVSKTSDQGYFSAHSSPRANCKSEKMPTTKE